MKKTASALIAILLASTALANEAHQRIQAMTEVQRQTLLSRYMSSTKENCTAVNKTFYQGEDKAGNAYWNVRCTSGSSFVVTLANDSKGSTKVLDCKALKALKAGSCFTKFK